jgi:RecB family exonuclease
LEEWSFRLGELSPGQERLNQRWRSTGELHKAFSELMEERQVASSGYIARSAVSSLEKERQLPWNTIWFAGLNALDPASTAVIKRLQQQGLAKIVWDADPYYLEDQNQEAGRYLRRSIRELGNGELPPQPAIMDLEREVHAVAAPNALAQTTYVAQRLAQLDPAQRSETAVVLADEQLLLPFLEQLPVDIGPINVTMGMPLKALPVNGLTDALLQVHSTMIEGGGVLVQDLESLLGHPFLHEGRATTTLIAALRAKGTIRVPTDGLPAEMDKCGSLHAERVLQVLAPLDRTLSELPDRFNALFAWAKELAKNDRSIQEQLFQMARLQQRLHSALERCGQLSMDLRTYGSVRDKLLREERIAFLGEPLRGLQVMGLLETRALDHERLFMVSMNEGTLPTTNTQQSWIPFDVRKHHHLPMPSDGEAISAYHFQRTMHLAKHVELIHNGGDDSGEASRFMAQWRKEVVGRSRTTWSDGVVAAKSVLRRARPLIIEKDPATLARLKTICERGLSPSALGTWLRCPMDFHFKYVLGIKDADPVDGTLGSDVLGQAVHNVLQDLFKPLEGLTLCPGTIAAMPDQVDHLLLHHLAKEYSPATLTHGDFRLRREMAAEALRSYLREEQRRCEDASTMVISIEEELGATLPNGVLLKGRSDRIDVRNGLTTVLDMKTGAIRSEDLRLAELTREAITPAKRYALQLMIYAWTYLEQHPEVEVVRAGIIPLQRSSQAEGEFLSIAKGTTLNRKSMVAIGDLLVELVEEMLDPDRPFAHDPDSGYCRFCAGGK